MDGGLINYLKKKKFDNKDQKEATQPDPIKNTLIPGDQLFKLPKLKKLLIRK